MAFIPPIIGATAGRAIFTRLAPTIGSRLGAFVEGKTGSTLLGKAAGKAGTIMAPWYGMRRGAQIGQEFSQGISNMSSGSQAPLGVDIESMYGRN